MGDRKFQAIGIINMFLNVRSRPLLKRFSCPILFRRTCFRSSDLTSDNVPDPEGGAAGLWSWAERIRSVRQRLLGLA